MGVLVLAVLLVSGVIALINSIPLSIRTIYSYNREFMGVTPRGDQTATPAIVEDIRKHAPVPIERVMICRVSSSQIKSIVGRWPFFIIGLNDADLRYYVHRQQVASMEGRLPIQGAPEAFITEPVAKNLKLKLGDTLLGPDVDDNYSPKNVKVVGIGHSDRWLMLTSIEYLREYHFPPIDFAMITAPNLAEQSKLDHWAEDYFKGKKAQVLAYHQIEKNTQEMFDTLYKILNVVIGTLALVITFMMGMLMNIYQSQRLVEFGLLQAIGYTKKQLLRRVLFENVGVIVLGWVLGLVVAYWLLELAKVVLMDPNAFALDTTDPLAYAYTIPIPFAILIVAIATVVLRFRKFDPVSIVERRLV
jgi:ABC-type lipoprotein release transport system permease subunit